MHKIYTPPATDVDMDEAEEEPKTNFNPAIRSVQAFPKAAPSSPSLLDGSPFHQVVNIKRQGQDASAAPDESVKPASASRASSVSTRPRRSRTLSRATSAPSDSRPPTRTPSNASTRLDPVFRSRQSSLMTRPSRDASLATTHGGPSRAHSPPSPAVLPDSSIDKPAEAPQEQPPQWGAVIKANAATTV